MGDRVYAWMEIGPWDEDALRHSGTASDLLDALDRYRFDDRSVLVQDGISVLRVEKYEANYGTGAFEDEGFATMARHLGLWLAWGDEGSVEWDQHHTVFAPDGASHYFEGSQCHEVVAHQADVLSLRSRMSDSEVVAALLQYFDEGNRSLGAWIAGGCYNQRSSERSGRCCFAGNLR